MLDVRVHFLPALVAPDDLTGGVSVVIDVLRATSTMIAALAAGARAVVPCLEVEQARKIAATLPAESVALGGERGGLPIPGFTLGNSPEEFTAAAVAGKTIVFTTTNGTRALEHCRAAKEVWVAAFTNLSALCQACAGRQRIDVLCAGTGGKITREDVLLAGAIVRRLNETSTVRLNDQAAVARDAWLHVIAAHSPSATPTSLLAAALRETQGGRNLAALGLERDIDAAAQIDRWPLVPTLDAARGEVTRGSH